MKDPDLQALIDKAKVEYDHDKAKALFTQIAQELDKQAITTYLPWQDNVKATTARVQDFHTLTGFEYPLQWIWVNDGK